MSLLLASWLWTLCFSRSAIQCGDYSWCFTAQEFRGRGRDQWFYQNGRHSSLMVWQKAAVGLKVQAGGRQVGRSGLIQSALMPFTVWPPLMPPVVTTSESSATGLVLCGVFSCQGCLGLMGPDRSTAQSFLEGSSILLASLVSNAHFMKYCVSSVVCMWMWES